MSKIFVQIVSYRDPQLRYTLSDIIGKAKWPDNLSFGIIKQYHHKDNFDDLYEYKRDSRFKIVEIPYYESKGVCWARNKVQELYQDELYTLQLDSHHRFAKYWDETLIKMFKDIRDQGYEKPIITAYAPRYNTDYKMDYLENEIYDLQFDRYIPQGPILPISSIIKDQNKLKNPIPTRFLSAHFIFTFGIFCKEVRYDPELYFHGEESSLSARAWTHGYDMFNPNKLIIWHEYNQKGEIYRPRHWDDVEITDLDNKSYLRYKQLFGMDEFKDDSYKGEYSFGEKRTLKEYEKWAGLNFSDREVTRCTLSKKLPAECVYETEESFKKDLVKFYKHAIIFPYNRLSSKNYDHWILSFLDHKNDIVYRKKINKKEIKDIYSDDDGYCKIWSEFIYESLPKKYLLTAHLKTNKNIERVEGPL